MRKVATSEPNKQQKSDHTIELTGIPDELLELLDQRVSQAGTDRAKYILTLLRKDLLGTSLLSHRDTVPHGGMTFEEILAPVHRQVEESGITEEELEQLFEEAREEVWQKKQKKSNLL